MAKTLWNAMMGASAHGVKPSRAVRYFKHQALLHWFEYRITLLVLSVITVVALLLVRRIMGTLSPGVDPSTLFERQHDMGGVILLALPLLFNIPCLIIFTTRSFTRERTTPQSFSTFMLPINPMERFKVAALFSLIVTPLVLLIVSFGSYLLAIGISWVISLVNSTSHNAEGLFSLLWVMVVPLYLIFLQAQGFYFFSSIYFKERRWFIKALLVAMVLGLFSQIMVSVIIFVIPSSSLLMMNVYNLIGATPHGMNPVMMLIGKSFGAEGLQPATVGNWVVYFIQTPLWWALSYWRLLKTQV